MMSSINIKHHNLKLISWYYINGVEAETPIHFYIFLHIKRKGSYFSFSAIEVHKYTKFLHETFYNLKQTPKNKQNHLQDEAAPHARENFFISPNF